MIRWKSRLGFLLLILLLCLTGAHASVWRIGMVFVTDGRVVDVSLADRLFNRFSSQFPQKTLSIDELAAIENKLLYKLQLEEEKIAHLFALKSDGVQQSKKQNPPAIPTVPSEIDTLWIALEFPESLFGSIIAQDPVVLGHLLQLHDLDQLIVAHATEFGGFTRLQILSYGQFNGQVNELFDRIALPQETENLLDKSVIALATGFVAGPIGVVVFTSTLAGVSISIDGVEIPRRGYFFTAPGSHFLQATALGYQEFQTWIQVLADEILVVDIPLVPLNQGPMLFNSLQGISSLWIQPDTHVSLPFLWMEPRIPFTYQASKEGFLSISGQLYLGERTLTLDFVPGWMDHDVTVDRSKDAFYASLGRTLLAFGLAVCAESISQAVSVTAADRVAWQPFVLTGTGVLGVSLIDTISRLFAYYRKTQYISQ